MSVKLSLRQALNRLACGHVRYMVFRTGDESLELEPGMLNVLHYGSWRGRCLTVPISTVLSKYSTDWWRLSHERKA